MIKNTFYLNGYEYTPQNGGDLSLVLTLDRERGAYQFVKSIEGAPTFDSCAFDYIMNHDEDQEIIFSIKEETEKGEYTIYTGYFTQRLSDIDRFNKIIKITPREKTLYDCIKKDIDKSFNFLQAPQPVGAEYEPTAFFEYKVDKDSGVLPFYGEYIEVFPGNVSPFLGVFPFVRERKDVFCLASEPEPPEGTGWQLLVNKCASNSVSTYVRKPPVFVSPLLLAANFATSFFPLPAPDPLPLPAQTAAMEDWVLMDTIDDGVNLLAYWIDNNAVKGSVTNLNNGRTLVDVINYGISLSCPDLSLQSEILTNDTNPVTGRTPSEISNVQLYAIGDIKNPTASFLTRIENTTLGDILEGLIASRYNCFWRIDENTQKLIIENYSMLGYSGVFDVSKYTPFAPEYKYLNDNIPKNEEYASLDSSIDFTGVDNVYSNPIAEGTKTFPTDVFYSEVENIINNPDSYPTDGVVVVSPNSLTPNGATAENGAITGVYAPNVAQGQANLNEKYGKFNRPFPNGNMNFKNEVYEVEPYKSLDTITIKSCSFSFYNPYAEHIGKGFTGGRLQKAIYKLVDSTMELEINA